MANKTIDQLDKTTAIQDGDLLLIARKLGTSTVYTPLAISGTTIRNLFKMPYFLEYYQPEVSYPVNATITLDNGRKVINTKPANKTNPNINMDGWVYETVGSADYATDAGHANTADTATNANHATTADSATDANHANTADNANIANTAKSATNAGHASTADNATNANHATTADSATTANTATFAESASSADFAKKATTADSAINAAHAVQADNATTADTADTAESLVTARSIKATGDASWEVSFKGTQDASGALILSKTGVTAGTYTRVTVDAKGRVVEASNPTTLAGYGITNAYTKMEVDTALSAFQTGASKFYATLAEANADIANIMPKLSTDTLKDLVTIGEADNGGVWYKASSTATVLTKSPFDPVALAKLDATAKANAAEANARGYTDQNINNLGIVHSGIKSISVAIVDEDDNRTWLEADEEGKPTAYAAQNILGIAEPSMEQKLRTEKPIIIQEAVLQATQETIEQVGVEQRSLESISVAIVDEEDTRTWLEADETGKPTDYSKSLLVEALDTDIAQKLADSGIGQSYSVGMSVAIVDEDDNRTWLEADEEGKPTAYAAQQIAEAIQFDDVVTPSSLKSIYQDALIKVASGPDIDCDGDSMTAGAGGNGTSFPSVLGQLMSSAGSKAVVRNSGVGGESSVSITARMGGYAFQVRVVDGVIPATTTPVVITFDQLNGQIVRPLMQGNGGASGFIGDLAGVKGSIALIRPNGSSNSWDNANYYTFTRLVAGNEVAVARPEPFTTDYAKARQGDIKVIWIGQNGPSEARAIQDARAIVQSMQALDKRYIVISKPTSSSADDALWFAEFGERFIPIKKYLIEFGLQDAGIAATEQDLADIAANNIPSSLRSDAVHWNSTGYTILAQQVFKKLKHLGWI